MNLTQAWTIAMLSKTDGKHFPRKPEELWSRGSGGVRNVLAVAKSMEAAQEADKATRKRGKAPREKIIMRPE